VTRGRWVNSGEYYRRTPGGRLEPAAPGVPDAVICRRVADYAPAPVGGFVTVCRDCGASVVTNISKYPDRPWICMQCAAIAPLPIES